LARPGRGAIDPLNVTAGYLRRLIMTWAVNTTLETARASTRSDVGMFLGQTTIWIQPHLPSLTGNRGSCSASANGLSPGSASSISWATLGALGITTACLR